MSSHKRGSALNSKSYESYGQSAQNKINNGHFPRDNNKNNIRNINVSSSNSNGYGIDYQLSNQNQPLND